MRGTAAGAWRSRIPPGCRCRASGRGGSRRGPPAGPDRLGQVRLPAAGQVDAAVVRAGRRAGACCQTRPARGRGDGGRPEGACWRRCGQPGGGLCVAGFGGRGRPGGRRAWTTPKSAAARGGAAIPYRAKKRRTESGLCAGISRQGARRHGAAAGVPAARPAAAVPRGLRAGVVDGGIVGGADSPRPGWRVTGSGRELGEGFLAAGWRWCYAN